MCHEHHQQRISFKMLLIAFKVHFFFLLIIHKLLILFLYSTLVWVINPHISLNS